ncbi:hypothetical protein JXB41_07335 [Candidatus Woesearchaeota archaeon]|nr:hypothetical protein [Candidatus Woesearchaeota archaeon]
MLNAGSAIIMEIKYVIATIKILIDAKKIEYISSSRLFSPLIVFLDLTYLKIR